MAKLILTVLIVALPIHALADLWNDTCEIVKDQHGLTCEDVSAPEISYVDDPEFTRAEYAGGDTIRVSSALKGINREWMVVHEMVHYLFSALSVLPLPGHRYIVCPSEAVAFGVSNEYLSLHGYAHQQVDWLDKYPYCEWMAAQIVVRDSP